MLDYMLTRFSWFCHWENLQRGEQLHLRRSTPPKAASTRYILLCHSWLLGYSVVISNQKMRAHLAKTLLPPCECLWLHLLTPVSLVFYFLFWLPRGLFLWLTVFLLTQAICNMCGGSRQLFLFPVPTGEKLLRDLSARWLQILFDGVPFLHKPGWPITIHQT